MWNHQIYTVHHTNIHEDNKYTKNVRVQPKTAGILVSIYVLAFCRMCPTVKGLSGIGIDMVMDIVRVISIPLNTNIIECPLMTD